MPCWQLTMVGQVLRGARRGTGASHQSRMVPRVSPAVLLQACTGRRLAEGKRDCIMSDVMALSSIVILLLPMGYFLLASPAFLLVKLDIPPVTQLLRGMFNIHFRMLTIAGAIGTVAFALAGRPLFAIGIGLIAAFAVSARRWFLQRMDAELGARDAGDPDAVRRLRRLHYGGMLYNAVQLVAVVGCIPYIVVTPT